MSSDNEPKLFTPAERIQQLSAIDAQIATLPSFASKALRSLTNPPTSLDEARNNFQSHIETYFSTLSSIDVQLRRQIYALQEAGLIQEGSAKDARDAMNKDLKTGGGGSLETSWLNSQAKDTVGKGMEAELWERARKLVERVEQGQEKVLDDEDSSMSVSNDSNG